MVVGVVVTVIGVSLDPGCAAHHNYSDTTQAGAITTVASGCLMTIGYLVSRIDPSYNQQPQTYDKEQSPPSSPPLHPIGRSIAARVHSRVNLHIAGSSAVQDLARSHSR